MSDEEIEEDNKPVNKDAYMYQDEAEVRLGGDDSGDFDVKAEVAKNQLAG